jgi:chemotaxis protein MotB
MNNNKSIIIKKVIKKSGGGHHGGAWKVAYADFVTAMMAFFLLLWLLNMSSDEKRIRLSRYFKHFSIYTEGGTSFMGKSSEIFNESGESSDKVFRNPQGRDNVNVENKKNAIETGISSELGGAAEQVKVDTTKDGIRIQIIDKNGSEMFIKGKTSLTPAGKKVLQSVGNNIKDLPNKVSIEGHTDSSPVEKKNYSNWELSVERALTARRELESSGLKSKQVVHVAGFADNSLLVKDNPSDPSNRRISIILHPAPKVDAKDALMPPKYSLDNPAGENIKLSTLYETDVKPPQEPVASEKKEIADKKSTSQPVIKEDWIPVIDKTDNQPVMDKGWSPVIQDEKNSAAAQETQPPPASIDKTADKDYYMLPKYTLDNTAGNNIKISTLFENAVTPPPAPVIGEKQGIENKKSTSQPVIMEDLIPVINKTGIKPVMDKGWSPVIQDEKKSAAVQEILPPPASEEKNNQIIIDKTADIEKLPYIKIYGADKKNTKSNFIQDLTAPVISGGELAK